MKREDAGALPIFYWANQLTVSARQGTQALVSKADTPSHNYDDTEDTEVLPIFYWANQLMGSARRYRSGLRGNVPTRNSVDMERRGGIES